MKALRRLGRCAAGLGLTALLLSGTGATASGHEFHRHHVGVFLGAASRPEDHGSDERGFAGGIDYEYRFSRGVGGGGLAEAATGDLRDAVVAALVFVHPWKGLLLAAGAGAEMSSHDTESLARLGLAYQFPIGNRYTLAPNFNVDLEQGDPTCIYGLTLGIGF